MLKFQRVGDLGELLEDLAARGNRTLRGFGQQFGDTCDEGLVLHEAIERGLG
jgi:hypothetical protein